MTINAEVFVEDPTEKNIPNLGVAKVGEPTDVAGWEVLQYELRSFVCDGAYENALDRILSSCVAQVGAAQPAAWVSGFYGSGKSHLVRVLEYLWRDVKLPSGSTARGLVTMTTPVQDALRELSTVGARNGGLWSAAGTLGAGAGTVRLGFLSIILGAAGLPTDYAPAECVMWLGEEGLLDQVRADIAARGLAWDMVLDNMYVSELADAILAAKPGWAASADMARDQIHHQFPQPDDINLADTMKMLDRVLRLVSDTEGKYPCALVVLDEMQQFINEDPDRAQQVQLLVEECSHRFGGLFTIVATGQSALQTTAVLQKLIDRFAIQVQLSDADVNGVIREVVLRKRPDKVAEVRGVLDKHAGEIDRQLGGARISAVPSDEAVLVADYPLLPARRRFWDNVLRSVDRAGKAGQLRSQLRVVHEANRLVARSALGTVVPADFIYDEKAADMLQSGVLLREIEQLIKEEREDGADGALRSRVLALVFLISQLSREGFADTGVRATAGHIADLLVDDLASSGSRLRLEVPRILADLHGESKLQRVDDEYFLQTRAGQEWTKDYLTRKTSFLSDPGRIASARDAILREAVARLAPKSVQQGASKTPRAVEVHFGDVEPKSDGRVPVWVRNGWDQTEKQFSDLAAAAGIESPLVLVHLSKVGADALADALADLEGAEDTLKTRARPTTDEGVAAQKAMESNRDAARKRLSGLVEDVVRSARVIQAGGNIIAEQDLAKSLTVAAQRAVDRLYPEFGVADHIGWGTAWTRTLQGSENALESVGFKEQASNHPVSKALLAAVSPASTSGADLRQKFGGVPYGWPRDAVHAGLAALVLANALRAEENGLPVTASQLRPNMIGKLQFRRETTSVPLGTRLAVRQVLQKAGIKYADGEESLGCASLFQRLDDLSTQAGGAPPLPTPPKSDVVNSLKGLSGNELIVAVHQQGLNILGLIKEWSERGNLKAHRLDAFGRVERILRQLPGEDNAILVEQLNAVREHRQLLDQPDPIAPIASVGADLLRQAVRDRVEAYNSAAGRALTSLKSDENWSTLTLQQREALLRANEIAEVPLPEMGTNDQILALAEARPLAAWDDRIVAVPARLSRIREEAARLLQPTAHRTTVPAATLNSEEQVADYVDNLRVQLLSELAQHKLLII